MDYRVAVNYYNDPAATVDATVAEIRALQGNVEGGVLPIQADIRSSSQVTAMFDRVIGAFGRLNLLVNNAGVQTWEAPSQKSPRKNGTWSSTQI